MFGLIWGVTARAYYSLRRFMPTNILLDAIHTRRGLKWGVPAMILAVPYAAATVLCVGLAEAGGSGWLNALAILFAWNALKILITGPVTLMRLLRVRGRESRARRRAMPDVSAKPSDPYTLTSRCSRQGTAEYLTLDPAVEEPAGLIRPVTGGAPLVHGKMG